MNYIKRLLTQISLTRATDMSFKDCGILLKNMDTKARKEFSKVIRCLY